VKKIQAFTIMILMTLSASAQFVPKEQDSSVTFKIKNFGFDVTGKFTGIAGKIDFDPENPGSDKFDITIDAGSINTDNSLRDKHLTGDGYFNVSKYPRIHFISTSVMAGPNKGTYILSGQLTIKDIVREIKFPFVAISLGEGYSFKGSFKIRRKDFGVGGTSTISDELEVMVNVQAKKA